MPASQLTVGPFLRGFYFSGVRPIVINDAAAPPPLGPASGIYGGAPAPAPAPAGRKVPQWVFVTQLFQMILGDKAALGAGGSSSKAGGMKRILYLAAAALCLLLAIGITISFFNNRGIESRVHEAKVRLGADEAKSIDVASTDSLRRLDGLRQELETLGRYKREGAPFPYRMGLYVGDDMYPEARRIYFDRFRQLLFGQTQDGILANLRTLPVAPGPDYGPTYDALKAYLITTSHHDKSTKSFLSPVLMRWWTANRSVDGEASNSRRSSSIFTPKSCARQILIPMRTTPSPSSVPAATWPSSTARSGSMPSCSRRPTRPIHRLISTVSFRAPSRPSWRPTKWPAASRAAAGTS